MSEQTTPITSDSVGPRDPTLIFGSSAFTHLAWLPVPLLLMAIIVARIMGLNESHRAETLTLLLGFIFYTLVSLGALFLIGRSFLATGKPGLLLLICGLVLWSLSGPVGDAFFRDDPNAIVTIFNVGILLAGLCILLGAILSLRPQRILHRRVFFLVVGCGASLIALWFITWAAIANWLPVFFITGQGGTLVRYYVLVAAILAFALSAGVLLAGGGKKSPFTFWYSIALLSLAVGLFGIMIQLSLGSVVNWLSRGAEWLGGLYLLLAAIASVKESRLSLLPAPDKLQRSGYYREAVAVALVLAAVALRLTFLPAMGMKAPYTLFYPAVLCAAIYGGIRAGLLAVGLSVILADYFWIAPQGQLGTKDTADWLAALIYVLSSCLVVWAADAMRRATSSAAAAKAEALLSAQRESDRQCSEAIALQHLAVQNGVNKILQASLTSTTEEDLGRVCLDVAEKITESKIGFIGEIGQDGFLHDIAISDTGWEACAIYDKSGAKRPSGTFPIHGLYGRVLTEGKPLFTNDLLHHPDSIGVPPGHPALTAFLGVPLVSQKQTIGMIAVANRSGGYSEQQREALETLAPAIVESFQRKRAEEALLESETKYRNLFANMTEEVHFWKLVLDEEGRIKTWRLVDANPPTLKSWGRTLQEITGKTTDEIFGPGATEHYMPVVEKIMTEGIPYSFEDYFPNLDKYFRFTSVPLGEHFITTGADISGIKHAEEAIRKSRDELELRVKERTSELEEAYKDLEMEMAERKQAEDALRQSQKMEAVGTLAGGIAHDFNNMLAAIIGFTEMAVEDTQDRPEVVRSLQNVLKSSMRARDLVKQILIFSRKSSYDRSPLSLTPLIKETIQFLRASIPTTIKINLAITASSDTILASPVEVQQILMNLATNASLAMQERGGTLEITLSDIDFTPESPVLEQDVMPGEYVQLTVKDTGIGMTPDVMKRVFDPFFTTREVGKGTGMGLAVVYGIVKDLQGTITVESTPGSGSTFQVFLPKVQASALSDEISTTQAAKGTERILFIDDEPMLTEWGRTTLTRLGYTVTAVTDSTEALKLFSSDPSRFDLVITDHTMPDMNGVQFSKELLKIKPDIPIILCTGHSETVSPEIAREAGIKEYLMKPMAREEFAQAVRRVLDEKTVE